MVADPTPPFLAHLAMRSFPVMDALTNKLACVVILIFFFVIWYSKATSNSRKSQTQVTHDVKEWVRFLDLLFLGHCDLVSWSIGNLGT
jgi:hypothetical protein